jgi:hypothetical protein
MKFMFSTVYRVTQKDFYACPYTSLWAPFVTRQISKRYSSSCHMFISIIDLRGLLEDDWRTWSKVSSVTCCLGCFPDTYFQQDGALPHFHRDVTTFLDETLPGCCVGRGSPTVWPPRSPDLTPLDFFAWGFIKDVVYRRKVRDLADLRQRIIEAVELITPHMLINTWQELEYRIDICRATTGAHIEVYGRA